MDKAPIKLQKRIKETYKKEEKIFENDTFMGKVTGISIKTENEATILTILTEKGSLTGWTVKYDKYQLNELERYLFNEIPLFKNGVAVEEIEILLKPYY